MRLKKIKLAGFKSFVDPTTINFETNLTGIVGPNGCGKSNIIDAVRWVMGEISAKQLRGESMCDVIFNGTDKRKPISQAAIELIFDNSDASLGGEYAKYSEIAIRREVNRDGLSDYYLNGTHCRRKDITDIFLGTGLGPRSYAIIEQGMISRLIEAKPEELRIYIEEAAGVSKYKERRKETENRIKHTKENLSRINDILIELEKQLKHLKYQANAAERFRKLKQEERLTKAELNAMHWRDLSNQLNEFETSIKTFATKFEDSTTELQTIESTISACREQHTFANESYNEVQENFYRLGANIARLEEQIANTKKRSAQLQNDLIQLNQMLAETTAHQTLDQDQINLLELEQNKLTFELESAFKLAAKSKQELAEAEQQMRNWQENWENINLGASSSNKQLEIEQARIQHAQQILLNEQQNVDKLSEELTTLDVDKLNAELKILEEFYLDKKAEQERTYTSLEHLQQQIVTERNKVNKLADDLNISRNELQTSLAKKTSLETLQQIALGKDDTLLLDWLTSHNLNSKPRLAEGIQVDAGWETAVETVFGSYLEAVCVEGLNDNLVELIKTLTHGKLIVLDINSNPNTPSASKAPSLLSKISSKWPIVAVAQNIFACENLEEAIALRLKLAPNESIITKDGIWLGPSWVRINADSNPKAGVIRREQEIHQLDININKQQELVKDFEKKLQQNQQLLVEFEKMRQNIQEEIKTSAESYNKLHGELSTLKAHIDHVIKRRETISQEIAVHKESKLLAETQLEAAKKALEDASIKKYASEENKNALLSERNTKQDQLNFSRENFTKNQQIASGLDLKLKLIKSKIDLLKQNTERTIERLGSLQMQRENLERLIVETDAPLTGYMQDLTIFIEKRLASEHEVTLAKEKVSNIEMELQDLEKKREAHTKEIEQIRNNLEMLRVERQGLQTKAAGYQEQIAKSELKVEDILAQIPPEANIGDWEQKSASIASKIDRLGPINLAAIEEYEKLLERKSYLDIQNQDLLTALDSLNTAINKIDQDAKHKFQETFDNINKNFKELFPKVFSGGKAYLDLVSNDLLETGVEIVAQPPGKRNSSIHLLSGGEKALTAISLIFSIFQLNPAPFCMLDEVDAPLDDVNVSRFCKLVSDMSSSIQFIFITHNKLSMEIAKQLAGVTMQEPGVSRIVTVDIDKAVTMATS